MSSVTCSSSPTGPHAQGPDRAIAALEQLGFEFGPPQPSMRSVLDTFDGRLHRAGARLDARPVYKPGSTDAVELSPHGRALPDRPLIVGRMPRTPADLPAGQFNLQLASIVEDRALLVQFTLASQCAHALRRNRDGKAVARVELHTDVRITDGAGMQRDLRGASWCLELHELPEHEAHAMKARRRLADLGLRSIGFDSLGWAAAVAGIEFGGAGDDAEEVARVRLRPDDRADRSVRAVLRELGDVVASTWQGAADDLDAEFLHDLRVALRRARTVLGASRDILPEHVRQEALDLTGALARATGAPRDLDVHLLEWPSYVEPLDPSDRILLEPVRTLLEQRRERAHAALLATMQTTGSVHWQARWLELIDTRRELDGSRPRKAKRPIGRVLAKRLDRAHRQLVRRGRSITPSTPTEQVHRLRKDAKELRYLLDTFGTLASKRHRREYLAGLKQLQDELGALQDTAVHRAELVGFETELRTAPQTTFDALAALAETMDARYAEHRDRVVVAFEAFDSATTRRALRGVLADLVD